MAMFIYHEEHGRLPPAVVYGKYGEPLYSWRVLILPYLEEGDLYREFKLDEPWDSPHNLPLLSRMPKIYAAPGRKAALIPPDHTFLHVFVGKGTAFENPEGEPFSSFTDGTSHTLLIVEAGEPVPWTKPEELTYVPDGPLPRLDGPFKDVFRAAFADGHVQYIKRETPEGTIRALITRNGGESLRDWQD